MFGPEGVGIVYGLAIQALVVGLGELCRLADGIGFGVVADIEHWGALSCWIGVAPIAGQACSYEVCIVPVGAGLARDRDNNIPTV
ncbi:hypothetical protein D3C77_748390 [compost metagenome]